MRILDVMALKWLKEEFQLFAVAFGAWLICFIRPIIGRTYTTWDTHDYAFTSFLYFSDSLKEGYIPLWNHFIQAGTFFPNFVNIGTFSPFQLVFVALSWLINPVYSYELMLQGVVWVGGWGAYLLFRSKIEDKWIALFGAISFAAIVLIPIVGQVWFLYSFSSIPWLVFACNKMFDNKSEGLFSPVFWGVVAAFYISSGYLWLNIVNLGLAALLSIALWVKLYFEANFEKRQMLIAVGIRLCIFFVSMVLVYGCLVAPGYLSLKFNYSLFAGDFFSPEPRLRGLETHGALLAHDGIYRALIAAIDPKMMSNQIPIAAWSFGGGWFLWIIFIILFTLSFFRRYLFWFVLLVLALLYSAGYGNPFVWLIQHIPVLNSNRWGFVGTFYVTVFLVFLVTHQVAELAGNTPAKSNMGVRFLLLGMASLSLLVYLEAPFLQYILVCVALGVTWLLCEPPGWLGLRGVLIGLLVIIVCGVAGNSYRKNSMTSSKEYSGQVLSRKQSVVITENYRNMGSGHDYIYNDERWLLNKVPFSHGYNHLGNPLYWYVKNDSHLEVLVNVVQQVRKESGGVRTDFSSDNEFAEAIMSDVLMDAGTPTVDVEHYRLLPLDPNFQWYLKDLTITPNSVKLRVEISSPAYVALNNVYSPGWEVAVDGIHETLVRTNHIFQGVLLNAAGTHDVEFRYRPKLAIALISFPYIMLVICLLMLLNTLSCNRMRFDRIYS